MSTQAAPAPEVRKLSIGPMDNNVYVVVDTLTNKGVIVDASWDASRIAETAQGVDIERILLTHGDSDHIDALEELKRLYPGVPVGIHPADADRLASPPDFHLENGEQVTFGNASLQVLHTPGHTPGSVCLYTSGVLLSGDTLFPGGPGTRGDSNLFQPIIEQIEQKLFTLPDDTKVLPGHGAGTTIGTEKPSLPDWKARGW
ncbi:MAG: MBL fold metallo-hydrolase [Chloroflexota bacterium]|nr:MBL fold metallo-hydrolase [Chloroflexota bacterium]